MLEIHPGLLWLGHAFDVREPRELFQSGIQAIVDVAYEETPAALPRQFIYCRFPLNDGGGNEPSVLCQAIQTTTQLLAADFKTLVACSAGLSRSPTIAAFSLASHLNKRPEDVVAGIAQLKSLELKPELWSDVQSAFEKLGS